MADELKLEPKKPMRGGATGKGFVPGDPRIYRGPGPRRKPLTALLEKYLEEEDPKKKETQGRLIVEALGKQAKRGNTKAIEQVFERIEGKVVQPIADVTPIAIEALREEIKRKLGMKQPVRKFRDEQPLLEGQR